MQWALEWKHVVCQNTCITVICTGNNVNVIWGIRGLIATCPVRVGEHVIHTEYNWLHNGLYIFCVFNPRWSGRFHFVSCNRCFCFVLLTHIFSLSLSVHVLQHVGVLPEPAERQFISSEDGSRAETSESHQPSAKWVQTYSTGPSHVSSLTRSQSTLSSDIATLLASFRHKNTF